MYEGQGNLFKFVQLGIYYGNGQPFTSEVYEHSLRIKQNGRPSWTHLAEVVDIYLENTGFADNDYEMVEAHKFNEDGYVTAAVIYIDDVYLEVRAHMRSRQN
jgi:hypothetical protein